MIEIKKAVRHQRKARIDLNGPSGSGKTFTALKIASGMGDKILVIDSEQNSSSLYADEFSFDVIELPNHSIKSYFDAIDAAVGYDVVIVDSLSHAWEAVNEEVTAHSKRSPSNNTFKAWGEKGTPLYNELLKKLLGLPCHLIVTMRVKSDYIMEEYQGSNNKTYTRPKKVGLAPKFREGGEYEFDLVGNINLEHELIVEKTRMSFLDGAIIPKPDAKLGKQIADWLNSGVAVQPEPAPRKTVGTGLPVTHTQNGAPLLTIPENPWMWKLQGDSKYKGQYIAALTDDVIKMLKPEKARDDLYAKKKLTGLDMEALFECYRNKDARELALAEIMNEMDTKPEQGEQIHE